MIKEFNLEPGEQVIREVRKHWFVFVLQLIPYAFLFAVPLTPWGISGFVSLPPLPQLDWESFPLRVVTGLWFLLTWTAAFAVFTRYYLNVWVLTNMRIVDVHQKGFFSREVSSLVLSRVQDITVETNGVLYSLLNVGNINVQSAGAVDRFTIRGIGHPEELRDTILKYVPNPASSGI